MADQEIYAVSNPCPSPSPDSLGPNCYSGTLEGFKWYVDTGMWDGALEPGGAADPKRFEEANLAHPTLMIFGIKGMTVMMGHKILGMFAVQDNTVPKVEFSADIRAVASVPLQWPIIRAKSVLHWEDTSVDAYTCSRPTRGKP